MTASAVAPREVRVDSDGIELAGDHWAPSGESRGAVLLLHGGAQRRHSWRRTGGWLAGAGWSAWAFDARGHGDSGRSPDGDYSISTLVDDAVAIIAEIGEAPVLVGASMGGMTSLIAEGERGPLARALVLVDIVARIEPEGAGKIRAFMQGAPDGFTTLEEAADAIAAYNPHRPRPKSLDGLRKNLSQRENGRWYWHWDPAVLRGGTEPELEIRYERARAAAQAVTVPTLLVRGGQSDIVSSEGLAEMRELIPQAQAVEVGAAGHMIAGDDNDVFTSELLRFVESTPRRD